MLGPPLPTSDGVIAVVTSVRNPSKFTRNIGKTGGIDIGHFKGFWEVLDLSKEGYWLLYHWIIKHLLYLPLAVSESRIAQ